jgi:glycosyltransferase involved in cell wall biosynthesis
VGVLSAWTVCSCHLSPDVYDMMATHLPLVSVIIPAYNAETLITYTLESVASQTYQNIEIIVVDDGSSDKTAEVVSSYMSRDPRIKLIQQANSGVAVARNQGIQAACGEYIAPIDADDIWYPEKLEKQVACFLRSDPSVGMVYVWSADIDENNSITGGFCAWSIDGDAYIPLIYSNFLGNASSPLIRRSCIEQVGGYNSKFKELNAQGCEDWELYLRIVEVYQVRVIPELLIGYRQFAGSMSANPETMQRSFEIMMDEIRQRHPEIPIRLFDWATSHYYCYLAERSLGRADYQRSLTYLYTAVKLDYLPLLYLGRYRIFLSSLVNFLIQPFTSSRAGSPTKSQFENGSVSPQPILSLEDLYRKIDMKRQGFLSKQRNWLLKRRWQKISRHYSAIPTAMEFTPS